MWELEKKLRHKLNFPCWFFFFFFFFFWVSFLFLAQSFWSCLNHNSVLHILYIPSKALTNKKHMVRKRYRKTTASGTHFPTILECSALSCHSWTTGSINTNLAIPWKMKRKIATLLFILCIRDICQRTLEFDVPLPTWTRQIKPWRMNPYSSILLVGCVERLLSKIL